MKKILVAIDFSKGSVHALNYARKLAEKLSANITMVWVDSECGIGAINAAISNEFRTEAIKNFNELIALHKKDGSKAEIDYKLRRGKVYQEVANITRSLDIDLIVAGTHGVTGFEEFWIGSNAYRIVSYAPRPVITVRFDYSIKGDFKNIVLPIDSTSETKQKVPIACTMARNLGAKIHIVGLHSTGLKSLHKKTLSNMGYVIRHCQKHNVVFESLEIQSNNITKSIIDYAINYEADLIAIMTEQQGSASSLLLGPQAEQLVNYSLIPVLSIQPSEIKTLTMR
ncbi:MAG: universal stress protein [Bacteroidales bacterium]|nr:universal stress protein [Bacteroidales bacterium]MDZ4205458.1 universal stress protein [Bacteroidales bacterium]